MWLKFSLLFRSFFVFLFFSEKGFSSIFLSACVARKFRKYVFYFVWCCEKHMKTKKSQQADDVAVVFAFLDGKLGK